MTASEMLRELGADLFREVIVGRDWPEYFEAVLSRSVVISVLPAMIEVVEAAERATDQRDEDLAAALASLEASLRSERMTWRAQ